MVKYTILARKTILVIICVFLSINLANAQQNSALGQLSALYNPGTEQQKSNAANFLTENMRFKFSYTGETFLKYDTVFAILRKMQPRKMLENSDPVFQAKWNEITRTYGDIRQDLRLISDSVGVSASYFRENIEYAFKVRKEKQWCRTLPDSIFNEFILPYRVGSERLESWRKPLYERYQYLHKGDSVKEAAYNQIKNTDMMAFAKELQFDIWRRVGTNGTMWSYVYDIPVSKMELGRLGSCKHLANYTAQVMRANGLPVAVDYCILWGNNKGGHTWNALYTGTGMLPFDAGNTTLTFDLRDRKIAKIYRREFAIKKNFVPPPLSDVPNDIYEIGSKDVTGEYVKTFDVALNIPKEVSDQKKFALIGTFDNREWHPQAYAEIKNGKAVFKNMGANNVYIGMYTMDINKTFGEPFILDTLGKIHYLNTGAALIPRMTLLRKYPCTNAVKFYMETLVGSVFECANKPDFSDHTSLFSIDVPPEKYEEKTISGGRAYRYFRYLAPKKPKVYIGELAFYDHNNNLIDTRANGSDTVASLRTVNDGDLNSYTTLKSGAVLVYDFGGPVNIAKIKYAARSDTNFILEGDTYQLCVWRNGDWVSLASITASAQQLSFDKVPTGGLFILHNLTKGKEERIFTYEGNKQIWW